MLRCLLPSSTGSSPTSDRLKPSSEISRINNRKITIAQASQDMRTIFALAEQTRQETNGYFDIARDGLYDPSGVVKGWAIYQAAQIMRLAGCRNFYIDAGGDIQAVGKNSQSQPWRVGIRNPFNMHQIVKVLAVCNCGVATSGTSIRGQHIYNAFAMGEKGIRFIERLEGFEGYLIDRRGQATFTNGFTRYIHNDHAY